MISMKGKNDFADRFDFFKWSAPICETPEEAVLAFEKFHLRGKVMKSISVIGFAEDIGASDNGLPYRRLHQAGMDMEYIRKNGYENMDKIPLPCEAKLYEPFQLIFTDGTTLEMMPVERGGIRIAKNSVPAGFTTGINKSNLDAQALFGEALSGKAFKEMTMDIRKESTTHYSPYIIENYTPYETVRTEYHYRLEFSDGINIHLSADLHGNGYRMRLCRYNTGLEVPYSRITAATTGTDQIVLIPGHAGGSTMRITPTSAKCGDDWVGTRCANWALSIDDDLCREFLGTFLHRYFDISIQKRGEYDYQSFDWYGTNRYSFETVKRMLTDVRTAAELLAKDYDSPELDEIKSRYHFYTFGGSDMHAALSGEEQARLIRDNIHIAVDFYKRFAERMEAIMREAADCDMIVFSGP